MLNLSVVIPAFNSQYSLPILVERLEAVLIGSGENFEIIVVDDSSTDNTWEVLMALKKNRPYLKIVQLLRNSGQHNAILCGFSLAKGGVIITLDDDLQNPPEEIPKLVKVINQGYDLVIGAYNQKKHTLSQNFGGKLIDGLIKNIFQLPSNFQLTSFRAVRKIVVDNVVSMGGAFPYVTCMLLSHTSNYANVNVKHEARKFGKSNYNLKRSLFLASNLLFSYSAFPLYVIVILCCAAFTVSIGLGIFVLWQMISSGSSIPGWASTLSTIIFFNGLILLALVIHSFYLSRINQQITRSRVSYTIGKIND